MVPKLLWQISRTYVLEGLKSWRRPTQSLVDQIDVDVFFNTVDGGEIHQFCPIIYLTGAKRREWMGMGVAGMIIDSYCGSFPPC